MQQSEAFQRQLRAHYAAFVENALARARQQAYRIAPMLVCLLWLAACATPADLQVTDAVSLPHALVSDACEEKYPEAVVTLQHAEILYSRDVPWALDCDLYDFGITDHRRVFVDFRRSTVAVDRIRHYLTSNGVSVPRRFL